MRVAGPLPTLQLTSQTGSAWQRALQPGQVLHALVVSPATAGTALLRVGALELVARTELALTRDQALLLEVVKSGDTPELRVLRADGEQDLLTRALRASLPRQAPLADRLGRLADVAGQLPREGVAAALAREVATLLDRAVGAGTGAQALQRALAQSGLFFEARLAQGVFDPVDLKGALLRLLARLQGPAGSAGRASGEPRPPSGGAPDAAPDPAAGVREAMRHLVEDALAGIRWQQISSLPDDTGRGPIWHVGLPLRGPDDAPTTLWLRAERDADGRDPDAARWTLDLSLAVGGLGPLHARLSLRGDALSATLWAEQEATAGLVRDHLDLLRTGLERAGIPLAHLAARSGRPDAAADQPAPRVPGLLDERA